MLIFDRSTYELSASITFFSEQDASVRERIGTHKRGEALFFCFVCQTHHHP